MGYAVKIQRGYHKQKIYYGTGNKVPTVLENIPIIKPYYVDFPWNDYAKSPLMDNALIITTVCASNAGSVARKLCWDDAQNTVHDDLILLNTTPSYNWICMRASASTNPYPYQATVDPSTGEAANTNQGPNYLLLQTNKDIKNIRWATGADNRAYLDCFLFNSDLDYTLQLINPASTDEYSYTFEKSYEYCYILIGTHYSYINTYLKPQWNGNNIATEFVPYNGNTAVTVGYCACVKENINAGDVFRSTAGTYKYKAMLFAFNL